MLKNFFRTAFRNIGKYKAYSIINFIGLACGLGLALLIIVYVRSEMGYDRFHTKSDRLYRLNYTAPNGLKLALSPPPIAPEMVNFFPDVEAAARLYPRSVSVSLPGDTETFEEADILFADSAIMKMFSFEFVVGKPRHPLAEEFTVILNEDMAQKYFGHTNPIGESLIFSGRLTFKVIGVVKNFPEQSHIQLNMLVPYENMFDLEADQTAEILRSNLSANFIISHSYTYLMLKPGSDPESINAKMDAFIEKYAPPASRIGQIFTLMPVTSIHLESTMAAEPTATNSMANLYIFIGVGFLTLIIASINYINLSTAQSYTRVKEIGIRKILGSMRYQLIGQFLAESFLFSVAAMAGAFGVLYFSLPLLNGLTGKQLEFGVIVDKGLFLGSFVLVLVITLLAGAYPAYFITQFESVRSLKGNGLLGTGDQFMRKALVVFQLTIAFMLLSGSLLIVRQLRYLEERPVGFTKDQVVTIPLYSQNFNGIFSQRDSSFAGRLQTFRNRIEAQTGVVQTALSSVAPGLGVTYRATIPEGFTKEDNLFVAAVSVDYDFLKSYGVPLVAGRGFDREFKSDEAEAYIVNETAVREFKWGSAEGAIGKSMEKEGKVGRVVGVVRDFSMESLENKMAPLVMDVNPNQFRTLSVKFDSHVVVDVMDRITSDWDAIFPEKSFEFSFLDDQLESQYSHHRDFGVVIETFAIIAMLISCLGVYGLVLFTVQRKVKEIGIRKVLGASLSNILGLICRDFALLTILGFVIAVPISYYLMTLWLGNFVYHTNIDGTTYLSALALVFVVVTLTIGYSALRAASANPVHALRSE